MSYPIRSHDITSHHLDITGALLMRILQGRFGRALQENRRKWPKPPWALRGARGDWLVTCNWLESATWLWNALLVTMCWPWSKVCPLKHRKNQFEIKHGTQPNHPPQIFFFAGVSHNSVSQDCLSRVSSKNVFQQCLPSVSDKIVSQELSCQSVSPNASFTADHPTFILSLLSLHLGNLVGIYMIENCISTSF